MKLIRKDTTNIHRYLLILLVGVVFFSLLLVFEQPYTTQAQAYRKPKNFDEAIELLIKAEGKIQKRYVDDAVEMMWKFSTSTGNTEREKAFVKLAARLDGLPKVHRNRLKAVMGEINIEVAMVKAGRIPRGRRLKHVGSADRGRSIYHHGFDAFLETTRKERGLRKKIYHVVESKSTEDTGRLTVGRLPKKIGNSRQMSEEWINKNYDDMLKAAENIIKENVQPKETIAKAWETKNAINALRRKKLAKQEKTLIITRVKGIADNVAKGDSLSVGLRKEMKKQGFHIIEIDPSGVVLNVYAP